MIPYCKPSRSPCDVFCLRRWCQADLQSCVSCWLRSLNAISWTDKHCADTTENNDPCSSTARTFRIAYPKSRRHPTRSWASSMHWSSQPSRTKKWSSYVFGARGE
jgi:hypothetical protein